MISKELEGTSGPWVETTHDRYWEMLEILPPAAQSGFGFLVGEPEDHRTCKVTGRFAPRFSAFVETDGRYFESVHPMTVAEFRHSKVGGAQ